MMSINIQKTYANSPFGQIHIRQAGELHKPALVLLHQTASSGMMFELLMHTLADDFSLCAPDTPGFGASFAPPNLLSVKYLSDAIQAALANRGVDNCYLFGHHTGAAIAVQMAFDYPEFVNSMVLSGPPLLTENQIEGLRASLRPFEIAEDGSHLTNVWERIRKRDDALPLEIVQREVLLTQSAREAAQGAYQAVFEQPFGEQLSALEIPVLVLAGENDTLRACLEPAYNLLQNGEMKVIPDAGPYICDQNTEVVAEILKDFFKEA